jgi:serine/threonine protein kinase/Tol biopolymer transport system component
MVGKIISHYRVLEKLGEGGMGVVYKARDTHLDRFVALKLLPPEKVADPERKHRFIQEAKAASALNHPNIITIHDIGESDGLQFIAMEFVPGRTLNQLIGRKGLRLNEALKYAVQIADALARAHAAGIIHRDLKPSNMMVDEHGLIKVLDFGLAKLVERSEADEFAPTETIRLADRLQTEEGMIVGTVAYMSPEQAEGKLVDARSDLFSFGSVLYEMIAGRRPFRGETKVATLSAILHKDPQPLSELVVGVPPELERLLGHCLRKDPTRRLQHMDDVKVELQALKDESDSGRLAAPVFRRHGVRVPAFVGALLLVIATAAITWWLTRPHRQAIVPALTRLTSDPGLTFQPALSADGNLLAYASDRSGEGNLDIWVQQVGGGAPIRLTHDPADEHAPAFSPDGRAIAFRSERGERGIYVVAALGGDARLIAERGRGPRFSPNGNEIAYFVGDFFYAQIFVVPTSGGQPKQLQLGPDFSIAGHPLWSHDGKRLLFAGRRQSQSQFDWWVASLTGDPPIKTGAFAALGRREINLSFEIVPAAWEGKEEFVLFSAPSGDTTNVWRIPISSRSGKVSGEPERLTSGAALEAFPSAAGDHLVFSSLSSQIDVWSLPVDADSGKVTGELQRLTNDAAADTRPSISQDGTKLAFLSNRSGNNDVWIKDLTSGKETPLTATPIPETRARISRDGLTVAYNQQGANRQPSIHVVSAQGGVPKVVCSDCGTLLGISADGKKIIYSPGVGGSPLHQFMLDVESGQKTEVLLSTTYGKYRPLFSPDGRWFTFTASVGSNPRRVFVAPSGGGVGGRESDWIAVTDAWPTTNQPDWSPDGNLTYFVSGQHGILCIWAQRLDPVTKHRVGQSFEVHHFASSRLSLNNGHLADVSLSVARDKLVFSMGERTGNIWMVKLEGHR